MRHSRYLLVACVCTLTLMVQGCSSRQAEVDAALEKVISSMEDHHGLTVGKDLASLGVLLSYDADEIARSLEKSFAVADSPARKERVAATAADLASRGQALKTLKPISDLAERWLFDDDSRVAGYAVQILSYAKHPSLVSLLACRLRQQCDKSLLNNISYTLGESGAFDVIEAELVLPRPADADQGAVQAWRDHVNAALGACQTAVHFKGFRLPAELWSAVEAVALKDEILTWHAVEVLVNAPPEEAIRIVKHALEAAKLPSSRIVWEAALIVVDDGRTNSSDGPVQSLADAVSRYDSREESWLEIVFRTQWLAFSADHVRDSGLLSRVWTSLGGMPVRERAQLLSEIADSFLNHHFSSRPGTNRLLRLLDTIPAEELHKLMSLRHPILAQQVKELVYFSASTALPEGVDRDEMNRIADALGAMAIKSLADGGEVDHRD